MKTFSFKKAEHLCLKKDIDRLFMAGSKAMTVWPLRAVWRLADEEALPPVKVMVSVSKRKQRHAVDRNRAKRQMREAYRRNKVILTSRLDESQRVHAAFIWLADHPVASADVERKMKIALKRMAADIAPALPQAPTPIDNSHD